MAPHTGRVTIFPSAAVTDKRLGAAAFRVLAALGRHGDKHGWCFPSLKILAADLGVSRQAISKCLQQLAALGYVQIQAQTREDKSRTVNRYRVVLDFDALDPATCQPDVDPPQCDVDTPQPSCVDTPQPLEVDALTSHRNSPIERAPRKPRPALTVDTFAPTDSDRAWAQQEYPHANLQRETDMFLDHARANDRAYRDWSAAWKNWIRKTPQFSPRPLAADHNSARRGKVVV